MDLGVDRTEKTYDGMACRTYLTRFKRAEKFEARCIQFHNLLFILSKSSFQFRWVYFPSRNGAPKYFEGKVLSLKPRIRLIFHLVSGLVLKKNK